MGVYISYFYTSIINLRVVSITQGSKMYVHSLKCRRPKTNPLSNSLEEHGEIILTHSVKNREYGWEVKGGTRGKGVLNCSFGGGELFTPILFFLLSFLPLFLVTLPYIYSPRSDSLENLAQASNFELTVIRIP